MDKKKLRKRKKRIVSAMVIATAFVVCILATFGVTMAYFGGKSGVDTSTLTLKTAVWVNATSTTTATGGYVVPSQAIKRTCQVKVKSSNKANGTAVTDGNKGSDSLLRATITWTVGEGITLTESSATSYNVSMGGSVVAKLMKWTGTGGDNNWYLVDSATTAMSGSATMYTIKSSTGEKTLTYDMTMVVPESIKNSTVSGSDTSKEIKVTIQYTVIQADFYNASSTTALAKTVTNAKAIFDSTNLDDSASY